MTDFKKELKAARAANDWQKADQLWKELCKVAEIEETSSGDPGGGAAIAKKLNDQGGPRTAYGKPI